MHGFEGYRMLDAPHTPVGLREAQDLLTREYGLEGACIKRIVTERDDTFAVCGQNRTIEYVLKIETPAESLESVLMRAAALQAVAASPYGIPAMRLVPRNDGSLVCRMPVEEENTEFGALAVGGAAHDGESAGIANGEASAQRWVALVTYVNGMTLSKLPTPYEPSIVDDIGIRLAQIQRALEPVPKATGFRDIRGRILWDVDLVGDLAEDICPLITDMQWRSLIERAVIDYDRVASRLRGTPTGLCHGDFHPGNLIVSGPRATRISGIIDFGDAHEMPLVVDVGTCLAYLIDTKNGNHAFDVCRRAFDAYRIERGEECEWMLEFLPAIFKARIALSILLPFLVERRAGERSGHYLSSLGERAVELSMLIHWDEDEIRQMLRP